MYKTAFFLVLAASLARRAAAVGGQYITFDNRDSGGGSLGPPTQTTTDTDCLQLCAADAKCYAYSFVAPTNAGDPGNCYRKGLNSCDPNAIQQTSTGTFSGIMGSSCTFMCGGMTVSGLDGCEVTAAQPGPTGGSFVMLADRDTGGGSLYNGSPTQTNSAEDCQALCNTDGTCYGYTYSGGNCYRKGSNNCDPSAIQQSRPGISSGIVGDSCTFTCGDTQESNLSGCSVSGAVVTVPSAAVRRQRRAMEVHALAERNSELCPPRFTACSLYGLSGEGYECVDLEEELERCGDCTNDCTASPGAKGVTCRQGRCMVTSCIRGYRLVDAETGDGHCQKRSKRATHPRRDMSSSHRGLLGSW